MTTNYNIITCDGGGIRGLITAILLNDLVSNPPQGYTPNVILSNVNLFAGTSTGGIIAIGLSCGLSPSSLVSFTNQNAQVSFTAANIVQPFNHSDHQLRRLQCNRRALRVLLPLYIRSHEW